MEPEYKEGMSVRFIYPERLTNKTGVIYEFLCSGYCRYDVLILMDDQEEGMSIYMPALFSELEVISNI